MKKLLAIVLSLAMAFSVVAGLALTGSAAEEGYINFGDMGTITVAEGTPDLKSGISFVEDATAGMTGIKAVNPAGVDVSAKEYAEFYVDASALAADYPNGFYIKFYMSDTSGNYYTTGGVAFTYEKIPDEGVSAGTGKINYHTHIGLEPGYKGYVRVPLAELVAAQTAAGGTINLESINQFALMWSAEAGCANKTLYFDDFRFGGNGDVVAFGDASTPEKIAVAEGTPDIKCIRGTSFVEDATAGMTGLKAVNPAGVDVSAAEYAEFYVDASALAADYPNGFYIKFYMSDTSGNYYTTGGVAFTYEKIPDEGVSAGTGKIDYHTHIGLEPGYKGYVRVPLAELVAAQTAAGGTINLESINQFALMWSAEAGCANKTLYFDDFRFGGVVTTPGGGNDTPPVEEDDSAYLVLGKDSTPDKIGTWTAGQSGITFDNGLIALECLSAGDVSISAGVAEVDASAREYFEFYVDISEISPDAPFAIVFRMRNGDGSSEYMSPSVGAGDAMQLIDANGTTDAALDDFGRIVLPAGFAGYVRMAVATFAADGLDMTKVASMVIWYGASANEVGKTIYFDNFRFGGEVTPPEGGGEDPAPDDGGDDIPVVYPVQGEAPANGGEILAANGDSETGISTLTGNVTGIAIVESEGNKIIQMKNTVVASDVSIAIDTATPWDASEMDYLEFWVDVSEMPANGAVQLEDGSFAPCFVMVLRVKDADGRAADTASMANYGPIFYQDADGNWVETLVDPYGRIWLPLGYSGYFRLSLAELAEIDSLSVFDGIVEDPIKPLDLSKLTHIRFWYTAQQDDANTEDVNESTKDCSVYFNDFKFVKAVADDDNTGDDNTGDDNTGDDNTGDDNTGNDNTGDDDETEAPDTGATIPVALFGVAVISAAGIVFARKRK